MTKTWSPTIRHALKKARASVDGPGDVVAVPGERGESTADSHASQPEPDTERNGNDTVPVGKKKR